MSNRVVLLTGASGGLGKEIAYALANAGFQIALNFQHQSAEANELIAGFKNISSQCKSFPCDLTQENAVQEMVEAVYQHFGRIDIVINNAGISFSGMSWKQKLEDWDKIFAINVTAPFLVCKNAIPKIREQEHGRIINISSIVAHRPLVGTSAYAASKAALEGFTKAQAVELSRFGITANCIAPGYFNTGMIRAIDETLKEELIQTIPAGRLGNASELVSCILYLCSEGADYITGQTIQLNGGLYL
ncbi:3-oxoacyl-[acyl-carrier-protein] reductase [soil metagenome]